MRKIILERADITLEEIKEEVQVDTCLSAIHRITHNKLGFTYKRQYTPPNETNPV
jgi:transposase